jgi:hypothetical protein
MLGTRAKIARTISLIIIVILISVAFFVNQEHPMGTPPLNSIVDGSFTVNAGSYKAYNFTIPIDVSQCQVSGSFSVSGENLSKIRVFIWDNAAFINWQSGHVSQSPLGRSISFYDSGLSTDRSIAASPPSGTYWLIYTNNSTNSQNVISQADFWYTLKE